MSYNVKATFAEGVTEEDIQQAIQSSGGDSGPPPGNISHEITTENGRLVYIDEWESQEAFEFFTQNIAQPTLSKAGIALPEVEEL